MIRPLREAMREIVRDYTLAEIKEAAIREALDMWGTNAAAEHLKVTIVSIRNYRRRYGIRPLNGAQPKLQLTHCTRNKV